MTADELAAIKRRLTGYKTACEKAWFEPCDETTERFYAVRATFESAAPSDISALLAEVERLREALRDVVKQADVSDRYARDILLGSSSILEIWLIQNGHIRAYAHNALEPTHDR